MINDPGTDSWRSLRKDTLRPRFEVIFICIRQTYIQMCRGIHNRHIIVYIIKVELFVGVQVNRSWTFYGAYVWKMPTAPAMCCLALFFVSLLSLSLPEN